ncbi:MAG: amidohydrolase family protein [Candidatus Bathyarchaeia archaeon]
MDVNSLLVQTALGKRKSDLVIKGGTLVNVYSGEVLENIDVAVKGDRIAYVGEDASHTIGGKTQIIDASKFFVAPGFIDAHTHIDFYCTPTEFSKASLLHGTTTVFAEPDELANVLGFEGIRLFVREVRRIPLRVYSLLPLCSPQDPAFENLISYEKSFPLFDELNVVRLRGEAA